MLTVGIIGILASLSFVSYSRYTDKAKAVEAEVALTEIDRLEQLHYTNHGVYSNDLEAIGFTMLPAMKYYNIHVQVGPRGQSYHASAMPRGPSPAGSGAIPLQRSASAGMSGTSGPAGSPTGAAPGSDPDAASGGGTGSQAKTACQAGGDATLAADGLLDMNFCLQKGK
jgi:Tfp pilus assembly protein PilE